MSRAKREKKSKINLKVWIPIICIIVVGVTFYMIYDMQNKLEKMDPPNTTNEGENISENNIDENVVGENNVTNESTNMIENTTNDVSNSTSQSNQSSAPAIPAVTDQKQKAIELVKKEWGKDDTVDYVFDYINENREYVVAVKDKASATVKYYFRVNLETGMVELD